MEEKIFYNCNDFKLCGLLSKVNDSDTIIVLCHGYLGSKSELGVFDSLQKELSNNNINSFRFDFRGNDESSGEDIDMTIGAEIEDLECSLDMLKEKGYNKFILLGSSFGGCIVSCIDFKKYNVISLISWYGALDFDRIEGEAFNDTKMEIARRDGVYYQATHSGVRRISYQLFLDIRNYKPYKNIVNLNIPMLFVQGTSDNVVQKKVAIEVGNLCKNCKVILIENGIHLFKDSKKSLDIAINETINFVLDVINN